MRTWTYTWKSSDGLRHEGEMGAPDKDSVYAALRERGIHAIKVTERIAPVVRKGFKGLRKRDISCIMLFVVCIATGVWFLAHDTSKPAQAEPQAAPGALLPMPRHFVAGFDRIDLDAAFARASDRFLSHYIQPGVPANVSATPEIIEELVSNVKSPIVKGKGDTEAVIEAKRVVVGVKGEIALLLAGGRSIGSILTWLSERQKMEAGHRARIIDGYRHGVTSKESANRLLTTMGLEPLQE